MMMTGTFTKLLNLTRFCFSRNCPSSTWIDTWIVKVAKCICQCCCMDLLKLLCGFVEVVLCISRPLSNRIKLKFDQDFKAYWSFCFELKVLNCYITSFRISQCNVVLQISDGAPLTWVKISEGDSLTANQGSSSCVKSVVLISNLQKGNAHYPLTGWRIAILTICCFCSSKSFLLFHFFLRVFRTWKSNKNKL